MAKGVLGFLEKVGVIEQTDDATVDAAATAAMPVAPVPIDAAPAVVPEVASASVLVELDQSARGALTTALRGARTALADELSTLLESLTQAIADEGLRYKTALSILGKKGHPVSAICGDLDKCIGVLEEKARDFGAQLKAQMDSRVGTKQALIDRCTTDITARREQMSTLQAEITALEKQRSDATSEIARENGKLNQVQERFTLVYQSMRASVEATRAKVTQYGAAQ